MLLSQQHYLMLEHSNLFQSMPSTLSRGSLVFLHPIPSLLMTSDLLLGKFWASNSISQPMRVERHIYIHTQIYAYTNTYIYTQMYVHTYINTYRLTYKYIQKYIHICSQSQIQTDKHTQMDKYIHIHIQIHTHTWTHQTSDLSFWTLESITKLCSVTIVREIIRCFLCSLWSELETPCLHGQGIGKWCLRLQLPITRTTRRAFPFNLTCPSTFKRITNS